MGIEERKVDHLRIVKIGGSVATVKGSKIPALRRARLREMAKIFALYQMPLILILGAGSFGHPLAKKYDLQAGLDGWGSWRELGLVGTVGGSGTGRRELALRARGALETHFSVGRMVNVVAGIFLQAGLPVFPISPSSIMENGVLNTTILAEVLNNGLIPLLHGDVVLDQEKGIKIYSGDTMAIDLARMLGAREVHFITRGAGVLRFGKTVEKLQRAELAAALENILEEKKLPQANAEKILFEKKFTTKKMRRNLGSRNLKIPYTDVTGGFQGKLQKCLAFIPPQGIYIYDGTTPNNIKKGFLKKNGGTLIYS